MVLFSLISKLDYAINRNRSRLFRNPKFHLPLIKHEFAKQLLQYCLIKLLNEDENASQIAYKVGEQPFCTFKSVIKYKIISSYNNTCIDPENCVSCQTGNIDSVEGI